jgi:hypothetical protein
MGTVNYKTSDYITLGMKPYDIDDFLNDTDFVEDFEENGYGTLEEYAYETINAYYEDDYENVKSELEKHFFIYFNVSIEYGYYEGFSLNIVLNPSAIWCNEDKADANKEVPEIAAFLKECAGYGMVACYPFWCTGYEDYKQTLGSIEAAIIEMYHDIEELEN